MSNINLHLTYERPLTMGELSAIMIAIENLYKEAYKEVKRKNKELELPKNNFEPKIEKVSEGSINFLLHLPELIKSGIELISLITDCFNKIKEKIKGKPNNILDKQSTIIINNSNINVFGDYIQMHVTSKALEFCCNNKWNLEDEECISIYAIREYVVFKEKTPVIDFVSNIPDFLMRKYGFDSLKTKMQNTKAIFEELKISNTLDISSLSNYSKRHKNFIAREINELGNKGYL